MTRRPVGALALIQGGLRGNEPTVGSTFTGIRATLSAPRSARFLGFVSRDMGLPVSACLFDGGFDRTIVCQFERVFDILKQPAGQVGGQLRHELSAIFAAPQILELGYGEPRNDTHLGRPTDGYGVRFPGTVGDQPSS